MRNGSGRAWRGLVRAGAGVKRALMPLGWAGVLLGALAATPSASAQVRQEGAPLDGRGGVVALSSGDGHSCAIRSDGTVACWGSNYAGQATPPEGRFIAVSAGTMHTCGLRDDGRLECWGNIQLPWQDEWKRYVAISSNGHYVCAITIEGQGECLGSTPFFFQSSERLTAFATTEDHACALTGDGSARCWGDTASGVPPMEAFKAIAVGYQASCGLRADGSLSCWGQPMSGEPLPEEARFTAITMGRHHACGLAADGTVSCWGDARGAPPAERFVAIAAGAFHTCGLRSDGELACWGQDFLGATTPPPGVFGLGSLQSGFQHSCQVRPDGVASCWGRDSQGQTQVPPLAPWETRRFTQAAVAMETSCGRRDDGTVQCWGGNEEGVATPPGDVGLHALSLGYQHGCGLGVDGSARCWGWNINGQAAPPVDALRSVSAGFVHTCGVRADGTAACWGYDGDGQLTPPPPPWEQPDLHIASMQAHNWGNCALFTSNDVNCTRLAFGGSVEASGVRAYGVGDAHLCWVDGRGELRCAGSGSMVSMPPPAGRYVSVSSGPSYACAIRSDGARVCWGDNYSGEYPELRIGAPMDPHLGPAEPVNVPLQLYRLNVDGAGQQLEVPGTFSVVEGELPPGLSIASPGVIQGTPTQGGIFRVTLEGRDADGFITTSTLYLHVDVTPPEVTVEVDGTVGDNEWYRGPVSIYWTVDEAESWVTSSGCEPTTLDSDSPGATFTCTASSVGGTTAKTVDLKLDATAPDTAIGDGPAATSRETTATFAFGGSDALSGLARFECSLDDAPFATCVSPLTHTGLAGGAHVFAVRAVDLAGNVDATPALHAWRVDATAPVITPIVEGEMGANGWYVGDVHVTWSVEDPESPLDTLTGCESMTLRTDTPGAAFTCTATSTGGTTSRTVQVKRDATAPVVTAAVLAPANAAGWYRGDVPVGLSCSDAMSGVGCPSTQVITGEGSALNSTAITVTDAAGNRATSNVVTVRIDRTAPTLAPVAPTNVLLNATVSATANGNDALSGVAAQSCTALVTGSVGQRTSTCTVTDQAGNSASAGTGYSVVYGFNGFTSPVQNAPVLNLLKAGRSVQLRWRVVDANGAPVTNLVSANVAQIAISCPVASENRIAVYGGSNASLQNLGNGYYQLDWPSASSLRNLCRRLDLSLGDGVPRSAQFRFN